MAKIKVTLVKSTIGEVISVKSASSRESGKHLRSVQ